MPRNNSLQKLSIADIANYKLNSIGRKTSDILTIAGIGELIEHSHVHLWMLAYDIMHKIATDKAAATSNDDILGLENLSHGNLLASMVVMSFTSSHLMQFSIPFV